LFAGRYWFYAAGIIASKLTRRLAWTLGVVVVAAAALIALVPMLIDTRAVQLELQRRLSAALGGQVSWQELDVRLLPAPRGELRGLRVEIPGKVAASADDVNVYLRFWPLLRGQPEVSSITIERPSIRVTQAAGTPEEQKALDAMTLYRAVMEPAARALQDFAPDMALELNGASVEMGTFTLRDVRAQGRTDSKGVELRLNAAATLWQRLSAQARVEYADLSARAGLQLEGLALDKDVPPAALRAQLRTDGKSALECDFNGSVGTLIPSLKGKLLAPAGKPPELSAELADVDAAQALALARAKGVAVDVIESIDGKLSINIRASVGPPWQADLSIVKSDAAVKLAPLPWKISPRAAQVSISQERVTVSGLEGFMEKSTFFALSADIDLDNKQLAAASGRARLELAQWFPWLRKTLPLEEITSLSGQADVALKRLALSFDRPAEADFDAVVAPRKASVALKALPLPVSVSGGSVRAGAKRVVLHNVAGSIGDSTFSLAAAQIELGKTPRISSASARASVRLDQWFPWLRQKLPLDEVTAVSGQAEVELKALALRFDRPAEADYDVVVTPRKLRAALKALPDAVALDGGSVRAGPAQVAFDNVPVAMLDARTRVSGAFNIRNSALDIALAEGTAGEKIVKWALERGEVPPRLEPRTPLRFAARRIAWSPKGALEADARVAFQDGPELALNLTSREELLELRRVAIKDARSDAVLSARLAGQRIEATFSGKLHGASIAAMLKSTPSDSVDRAQAQNSIGQGRLEIEALDLTWLAGRKVLIERVDLSAEGDGVRVVQGRFAVEDQQFELRGESRRTAQGPVIQARLESPGVVLQRLLPPPAEKSTPEEKSQLWPLPLTGRIEVRAGFVQFKRHRIEPFDGSVTLEARRARLEVKEARTCGVSFPMELEAVPDDVAAWLHLSMRDQELAEAVGCLTGGTVAMTGRADLRAELQSRGRQPDLVRNLTGTAQAEVRDGRVKKFALIGNLLAFRGIASLEDMAKADGFPYRRMMARGHFTGGRFMLEEGFFDSNAARLAASGHVDLLGENSHLSVLIAPLTTVERIVGAIPLIGDVFGGTMVALPVAVHGDIRDPVIVPLGPRAITDQLLGIFERTLKLPGKLAVPAQQQPKP
jgi:AsmA-like C-terminal region/AsmA family